MELQFGKRAVPQPRETRSPTGPPEAELTAVNALGPTEVWLLINDDDALAAMANIQANLIIVRRLAAMMIDPSHKEAMICLALRIEDLTPRVG